ncbi:MAG: TrkH family potassium uptake protein [Coriobacteriales bacterium]
MPATAVVRRASGPRTIARYVGFSVMFIGAIELLPLLVLLSGAGDVVYAPCFIFPAVGAMTVGYLLYFLRGKDIQVKRLGRGEGAACTVIIWCCALVIDALPFALSGLLTVPQSVFEAASGITTTGMTVIDPDQCPAIFLLHRSLMHYFGGVGLVLVLTTIVNSGSGLSVYHAEGHTDRLLPRTVSSARMILLVYTGIIAAGIVAYWACGMPPFDALNMSISAVSTGGFAVHRESIGYYGSAAVEAVSIVLMLAGATNSLLNFMLVTGRVRGVLTHVETRYFYGIVAFSSVVVALVLLAGGADGGLLGCLRVALFHVVSTITTTGFQTIPSFSALPSAALFVLFVLMFTGSEAGSTSGGIKIYRVVIALKGVYWSLRDSYGTNRHVYSHKVNRFGKRISVTPDQSRSAGVFILIYLATFLVGAFVFALCGASLQEAFFDFASCLGDVGIGVGFVSADSSAAVLVCGSIGMIVGRLEVIPVFLGIGWLATSHRRRVRHERED